MSTLLSVGIPAFAALAVAKVTIVLAAAALALAAMRRASAATRHFVLASATAASLAAPVLTLVGPSWRLPAVAGVPTEVGVGERPEPIPQPAIVAEARAELLTLDGIARAPRPGPTLLAPTTPAAEPAVGPRRWSWSRWLLGAWCLGAAATAIPALIGGARLRRLARRSRRLEGPRWDGLMDELGARLGLSRRVTLLRGDATTPMTWGVIRPAILLPESVEGWPVDRVRAALAHELAHVARRDCLAQLPARLACVAYWFHPLAWWAAARMLAERERACDDLVLASGWRGVDYATRLLEVARGLRGPSGLAGAAAMARTSQVEDRVRAILDGGRNRQRIDRRGALVMSAAVAALAFPLASARIDARAAAPIAEADDIPAGTMTISGRVLDPGGRPVAGAKVAVVGRRKLTTMTARSEAQSETLGTGEADAEGRFRLEVRRTSSVRHYDAHALALAPGFGLGWAEFNRDAPSPTIDVSLRPEQVVAVRLLAPDGKPAAGVGVRVTTIGTPKPEVGGFDGLNLWPQAPAGLEAVWPADVKTDAEGRIRLAGIGRSVQTSLQVDDPRFARQGFRVPGEGAEGPNVDLTLKPALRVSGRITAADTGEPIPGAIVQVGTSSDPMHIGGGTNYRADAEGRYEAYPAPGTRLNVTAYPPSGSSYLVYSRTLEKLTDASPRVVDLVVPRGMLIEGRVVERGGRPLAGASVFYENGRGNVVDDAGTIPGWMSAVTSGPDGRYVIAVDPGKGTLLVYGPTADYVLQARGSREIEGPGLGGRRDYAHAFLPYQVKAGQSPASMDATLEPGATVVGRVEDPEGRAVDRAEIITTLSISPFHTSWRGDFTVPVRDGRFEIHGVPVGRAVRCSFLEARRGLGATIEVDGAQAAAGPLAVKLQPCGSAALRLVDAKGGPVKGAMASLNIVATPGPGVDWHDQSLTDDERKQLAADEEIYANVDRVNYWGPPKSGDDGRVVLPRLIPGATYRIYEPVHQQGPKVIRWRDFTVAPLQALDLGDVRTSTDEG